MLVDSEQREVEVKLWGKQVNLKVQEEEGVFQAVETDPTGVSSTLVTSWKVRISSEIWNFTLKL